MNPIVQLGGRRRQEIRFGGQTGGKQEIRRVHSSQYNPSAVLVRPHVKGIQKKKAKQSLALTKILASTFTKARHVYTAVVRPALMYGSAAWHLPAEVGKSSQTAESKMAVMQNQCLRTVAGAFKAIPIKALEAETHVAPLSLHLNRLQAKARPRMKATGVKQ